MKKIFISLILGSIIGFGIIVIAQEQNIRRGGGSSGGLSGTLIVSGTNASGMVLTAADNKVTNGVWSAPIWMPNFTGIVITNGTIIVSGSVGDDASVIVGHQAAENLPSGLLTNPGNVIIGHAAGRLLTNSLNNIIIGESALNGSDNSLRSIAIGVSSLNGYNGDDHVAIGFDAFGSLEGSDGSIAIGNSAGATGATLPESIYIGFQAGMTDNNVGTNVVIGFQAIGNGGSGSVVIGAHAIGGGADAIAIGNGVTASSGQTVIGNTNTTATILGGSSSLTIPDFFSAGTTNQWKTGDYVSGGKVRVTVNNTNYNLLTDSGAVMAGSLTSPAFDLLSPSTLVPLTAGTLLDFSAANRTASCTLTGSVSYIYSFPSTTNVLTYNIQVQNAQATNCNFTFPAGTRLMGVVSYQSAGKGGRLNLEYWPGSSTNVFYIEAQ